MIPLCIAHRGASAEAPENTLRAFHRAVEQGADGIELDVQVTLDGRVVVFHDDTLTRLTGTPGRLARKSWKDVQSLSIGGEPIPTLVEVLRYTRRHGIVQIEIKKGVPVAPVVAAVQQARADGQVILASFETAILREAAALAPAITRMVITDGRTRATAPAARALKLLQTMASVGAGGLSVNQQAITGPEFVRTCHLHGASVWTWTVNNPKMMKKLANWGVNALLSDDPGLLKRTLAGSP